MYMLADQHSFGIFNGKKPTFADPSLQSRWRSFEEYERERSLWYLDGNYEKWGREGSVLADDYMSKLVNLCKEHRIEVTIVIYPWPRQVKDGLVENRHVIFWRSFANQHHIKFINLFPLFMQSPPETAINKFYIAGDIHFNEEGHRMIAQEYLKQSGLHE